jgi:hypothetical protein
VRCVKSWAERSAGGRSSCLELSEASNIVFFVMGFVCLGICMRVFVWSERERRVAINELRAYVTAINVLEHCDSIV